MTRHMKLAVTVTAAIAITTLGAATGEARPPWSDSIPECAPELGLPGPEVWVYREKISPKDLQLAAVVVPEAQKDYPGAVVDAILWRPGGRDTAQGPGSLGVAFIRDGNARRLNVGIYDVESRIVWPQADGSSCQTTSPIVSWAVAFPMLSPQVSQNRIHHWTLRTMSHFGAGRMKRFYNDAEAAIEDVRNYRVRGHAAEARRRRWVVSFAHFVNTVKAFERNPSLRNEKRMSAAYNRFRNAWLMVRWHDGLRRR